MIINKLQLITNYLDVGFIVWFYCSLANSFRIASCCIYNVMLKLQKNDKKRHICCIYHNNDSRKKIKLT
jgi:hypothetical protein